jgi:hypothetical protein
MTDTDSEPSASPASPAPDAPTPQTPLSEILDHGRETAEPGRSSHRVQLSVLSIRECNVRKREEGRLADRHFGRVC